MIRRSIGITNIVLKYKLRVTLKDRHPPSLQVPFMSFARLSAIDSPSPLPSVFRELSPPDKTLISSSLEILSGVADTFLKGYDGSAVARMMSMYTLVPGLGVFVDVVHQIIRNTLHRCIVHLLNHNRRNVILIIKSRLFSRIFL